MSENELFLFPIKLCSNLAASNISRERKINFILDLENIEINIETANPCGLIINELVSNSLEHGFVGRDRAEGEAQSDRGNIWLSLKQLIEFAPF